MFRLHAVASRPARPCFVAILALSGLFARLPCAAAEYYPHWWYARGVAADTTVQPDDYAAANQGQAKWIASGAKDELDANLPGGAGAAISNLVAGFVSTNDFLALNLGQLKFLAAPFYDRLREVGWSNAFPAGSAGYYPWTPETTDDNDFSVANLGQLKWLFSFDLDLCRDTDGDGMSDGFEYRQNLDANDPSDAALPSANPWAHGLTNLQVFQNRSVLCADNYSTLGDGIPDWWKVKYGYAVNDGFVASSDDDGDMRSGLDEYRRGSDPTRFDLLTLRFERQERTVAKGGFEEYQPSAPPKVKMYLWEEEIWTDWILVPFTGCDPVGAGGVTSRYDVATESYAAEPSGVGLSLGKPPATSPTARSGTVTNSAWCAGCQWVEGGSWYTNEETQEVTWDPGDGGWSCPGHEGTQQVQMNLFDEFTTPMLLGHLVDVMPPFADEYDQVWIDTGVFGFVTDPLEGAPAAWFDVSTNELTAGAGKIQYKFWLDSAPHERFVSWMEVFTPEDDPETPQDESATPEYTFRHWPDETHHDTGQDETPVYTIDPLAAPAPRQGTYRIVVLKVELVHAEGEHEGEPMDYLPLFRPSSGMNAGVPTYSSPSLDLALAFAGALNPSSIDSLSVTYLGKEYIATETGANTLEFRDSDDAISVTLIDSPLSDANVQESLTAVVDLSADGIGGSRYECVETTASSLIFNNSPCGVVMSIGDLSPATAETMHIELVGGLAHEWNPVETDSDSLTFVDGDLKVQLVGTPALTADTDSLLVAISDSAQLVNTVFLLQETGATTGVFRNYAEPTPTSLADASVPDFVPWRVKIHGISDPSLLGSFVLRSPVDSNDQLTFTTVASLLSDQKIIVIPQSADPAEVPAGYSVLKVDDAALDWSDTSTREVAGHIQLVAMATQARVVEAKVQTDAVVLQSLDSFGQDLDPEKLILKPLTEMGYVAERNYNAKASDTLSKYIIGKQVWYSMSHGATEDRTPHSWFTGLLFRDGAITASDIKKLGLKYRLVIADGCCTAQTMITDREDARMSNELSGPAQDFAKAFGPKCAYVGWAWEMRGLLGVQSWTSAFVNNLKFQSSLGRGRTVKEAHDKFLQDYPQAKGAKMMKIYGSTGNIIDQEKSK